MNQVRIIGGQWRGRKLDFPDAEGLRPTSDRIRETLFNWLAPAIAGSHCLDLFAGSGALGFEAASRGAARVVMVDRGREVSAGLERMRERLSAAQVEVRCASAEQFLADCAGCADAFDIVFLDPPFADIRNLTAVLGRTVDGGLLKPGGYLYLETPRSAAAPVLPAGLEAYRDKQAGQVHYRLLRYYPQQAED